MHHTDETRPAAGEGLASQWLPLPPLLAWSLPWKLESAFTVPLPVHELAGDEGVAQVDPGLRPACEEALRRQLREVLTQQSLPDVVLASPVREAAVQEVRAWLSRHGMAREEQPAHLTIRDALTFIGRHPNRLLQCLNRAEPGVKPRLALEELESVPLRQELIRRCGMGGKSGESAPGAGTNGGFAFSLLQPPDARKKAKRPGTWDPSIAVAVMDGAVVTARDPRFGWAVRRIHGAIALTGQPLDELAVQVQELASEPVCRAFEWLQEVLAQARTLTCAEETQALIEAVMPRSSRPPHSAISIIGGRFGLGGQDLSLEECASAIGLTRERVRQVQVKVDQEFEQLNAYAPALARLARTLEKTAFRPAAALALELKDALGGQTLLGAYAAARMILGSPPPDECLHSAVGPFGLRLECWSTRWELGHIFAMLRSARSMASRVGAFHLTTVAGDVSEDLQLFVPREDLQTAIDSCEQFTWLDRESGWGTVEGLTDAPVLAEVRKMLAACHPLSMDFGDLYAGLASSRRQVMARGNLARFGGAMPPPWVLRRLFESQPELDVVQYDNFRLRQAMDPTQFMEGEAERVIYRKLVEMGGVASWGELRDALVGQGLVNPITFGVVLKTSSQIYQPGFGLYAVRGMRLHIGKLWVRSGEKTFPRPPAAFGSANRVASGDANVLEVEVNQTTSTEEGRRYVYVPQAALPRAAGTYFHEDAPAQRIRINARGHVARLADELASAGIQPRQRVVVALNTAKMTYTWREAGDSSATSA